MQNADDETRASLEFQKKLWNGNPISKSRRGNNINVDSVIGEEEFRKWFVKRLKEPVLSRESTKERTDALATLSDDVTERVKNYQIKPTPYLKIARALAAFYPRDFTTVFGTRGQGNIAKSLGISIPQWSPKGHRNLLQRLEKVLGSAGNDFESVAVRMCLPRLLHVKFVEKKNSDAPESDSILPNLFADVTRAPLTDVQSAIRKKGYFPAERIVQLDAGLWANERRYFAVLTGLSGAGKTLSPEPTASESPEETKVTSASFRCSPHGTTPRRCWATSTR